VVSVPIEMCGAYSLLRNYQIPWYLLNLTSYSYCCDSCNNLRVWCKRNDLVLLPKFAKQVAFGPSVFYIGLYYKPHAVAKFYFLH